MINQSISNKVVIENVKISYNDQFRSCIKVRIEPTKKAVRNNWENWLNEIYSIKVHGANWLIKKDVLSAKRIKILAISDKQIDLHAKVVDQEQGQGSTLYIFASFGQDIHITPETFPKEYRALENLTLEFLTAFFTNYYRNLTENLQLILRELAESKNSLQNDLSSKKKGKSGNE